MKELRGTESTKKSIQKLKKTTKEPRDSPDIILSISYRGVKFLNTITRVRMFTYIFNFYLTLKLKRLPKFMETRDFKMKWFRCILFTLIYFLTYQA